MPESSEAVALELLRIIVHAEPLAEAEEGKPPMARILDLFSTCLDCTMARFADPPPAGLLHLLDGRLPLH